MVIVGWHGSGSLGDIFDKDVFKTVLTIFITSAYLTLLQGCDVLWYFLFLVTRFFYFDVLMVFLVLFFPHDSLHSCTGYYPKFQCLEEFQVFPDIAVPFEIRSSIYVGGTASNCLLEVCSTPNWSCKVLQYLDWGLEGSVLLYVRCFILCVTKHIGSSVSPRSTIPESHGVFRHATYQSYNVVGSGKY